MLTCPMRLPVVSVKSSTGETATAKSTSSSEMDIASLLLKLRAGALLILYPEWRHSARLFILTASCLWGAVALRLKSFFPDLSTTGQGNNYTPRTTEAMRFSRAWPICMVRSGRW